MDIRTLTKYLDDEYVTFLHEITEDIDNSIDVDYKFSFDIRSVYDDNDTRIQKRNLQEFEDALNVINPNNIIINQLTKEHYKHSLYFLCEIVVEKQPLATIVFIPSIDPVYEYYSNTSIEKIVLRSKMKINKVGIFELKTDAHTGSKIYFIPLTAFNIRLSKEFNAPGIGFNKIKQAIKKILRVHIEIKDEVSEIVDVVFKSIKMFLGEFDNNLFHIELNGEQEMFSQSVGIFDKPIVRTINLRVADEDDLSLLSSSLIYKRLKIGYDKFVKQIYSFNNLDNRMIISKIQLSKCKNGSIIKYHLINLHINEYLDATDFLKTNAYDAPDMIKHIFDNLNVGNNYLHLKIEANSDTLNNTEVERQNVSNILETFN